MEKLIIKKQLPMLNISRNRIHKNIDAKKYQSLSWIDNKVEKNLTIKILYIFFGSVIVLLFFPWTQNIRSNGAVTTLNPDQRPQTLHSVIGGRIEKWYVKEGDFAKKGDTLMYISETNDQFFDPDLLSNTEKQISAKEQGVVAYMEKVKSLDNQIDALLLTKKLKLKQAKNRIQQSNFNNSSYLNDGQPLSYINCGNDPAFDIQAGSFSISSWIKLSHRNSSDVIMSKASVNTQNVYSSYDLRLEYGSPTFTTTNDNANPTWYTTCKSTEILDENKWYHIVAIGDASLQELRIYINGQLSHSVSWTQSIHGGQNNLLIGCN